MMIRDNLRRYVRDQSAKQALLELANICREEGLAETEDAKDFRELAQELQELAKRTYV